MSAGNVLSSLLFPARCPFCRNLLKKDETGLCGHCRAELPWVAPQQQGVHGDGFEICVSPLWYRDAVRESFHRYKFQGVREYARIYGPLVARCIGTYLEGRYDLITWAPLSRQRRRERGYDQAYLLAASAARTLGLSVTETLRKVRNPQAQSSLEGAAARRINVQGCYETADPARVTDKRVLLIDDIVTTGSTLSECAHMLKAAGAQSVVCATFARTGKENGASGRNL